LHGEKLVGEKVKPKATAKPHTEKGGDHGKSSFRKFFAAWHKSDR
jgi:hypothetical protein